MKAIEALKEIHAARTLRKAPSDRLNLPTKIRINPPLSVAKTSFMKNAR